jgi:N-acetyltransferase
MFRYGHRSALLVNVEAEQQWNKLNQSQTEEVTNNHVVSESAVEPVSESSNSTVSPFVCPSPLSSSDTQTRHSLNAFSALMSSQKSSQISLIRYPNKRVGSSLPPLGSQEGKNKKAKTKFQNPYNEENKEISPSSMHSSRLSQVYLDCGQSSLTLSPCPLCHMVYTRGEHHDELLHNSFHSQVLDGITLKLPEKQINSNEFLRGLYIISQMNNGRIYKITNEFYHSSKRFHKVWSILQVMNNDLGGSLGDFKQEETEKSLLNQNESMWIYLTTQWRVACVAIVHPLNQAHLLVEVTEEINPTKNENDEQKKVSPIESSRSASSFISYQLSDSTFPVDLGVSKIWTHRKYRGQGLAALLLDAVRMNFSYSCVLDSDRIAFSQPTEAGRAFARKYTGKKQFLAYRG